MPAGAAVIVAVITVAEAEPGLDAIGEHAIDDRIEPAEVIDAAALLRPRAPDCSRACLTPSGPR